MRGINLPFAAICKKCELKERGDNSHAYMIGLKLYNIKVKIREHFKKVIMSIQNLTFIVYLGVISKRKRSYSPNMEVVSRYESPHIHLPNKSV
ncbi:MAG: hypothetical protein ACETVN_01455, partial [Asgard group archaeon]